MKKGYLTYDSFTQDATSIKYLMSCVSIMCHQFGGDVHIVKH